MRLTYEEAQQIAKNAIDSGRIKTAEKAPPSGMKKCKAEECSNIFARARRAQLFCGSECKRKTHLKQKAARSKMYRANKKAKEVSE
jgi:hypothetical protein